jgi:NADH dehydrogenase FAD-containing subunit
MQAHDSSILTSRRHRVVIVGAGFGGLFAEGAAGRRRRRDGHRPHEPSPVPAAAVSAGTGILAEGDIAPPIRDMLRRQCNASVILGEVEAIDLDARRLTVNTLGQYSEVPYDSVILAAGTQHVLRSSGVRASCAGNEDDRRRAGAARADLRRVRDG